MKSSVVNERTFLHNAKRFLLKKYGPASLGGIEGSSLYISDPGETRGHFYAHITSAITTAEEEF